MSTTHTTSTSVSEADAYGCRLHLQNKTLRIEAKGRIGHQALGTAERVLSLDDIQALAFEPAGRLKNGKLELVSSKGKTVVHVRHKQNDEVRAIYEALRSELPDDVLARSTEGASLFSEDRDAWAESKKEQLRQKHER